MKGLRFASLTCAFALLGITATEEPKGAQKEAGPPPTATLPARVAGYRAWACANPEPVKMISPIATQCMAPTPQQIAREKANPHVEKWARVYVNDAGKTSFLRDDRPVLPVGTVLVKEKLPAKDANRAELLTVMVKREKGYDPKFGDWEYAVLSGDAKTVRARGRLANCRECHAGQERTGYVFRWYRTRQRDAGK